VNTINFRQGILDKVIDAVYVLLLEGSDRTNKVYRQVHDYQLSKNNHILINQGYKKCKKDLCDNKSYYDLMDANIQAFKHAENKGYQNILVLEDDFIFDHRIRDPVVLKDLESFINHNEFTIYSLGSFNYWVTLNLKNIKHPGVRISSCAHALILSKGGRETILSKFKKDTCLENTIMDGLHDQWYNIIDKRYSYYKPICYQTFPITENYREWGGNFIGMIFRILKLDVDYYPGWDIMYLLLYVINILPYVVLLYVLLSILN